MNSEDRVEILRFESVLCRQVFGLSDSQANRFARFSSGLCDKLKFCFLSLNFWIRVQTCEKSRESYKKAFLVSLIKSSVIDPCYALIKNNSSVSSRESSVNLRAYDGDNETFQNEFTDRFFSMHGFVDEFCNECLTSIENVEYLKELKLKLSVTFCPSLVEKASSGEKYLNLKIMHALCEYQAIYSSIVYLFEALFVGEEMKLLELELFFNGSFLHNFAEELQRRINPSLYIEELFGRRSFFKFFYNQLSIVYEKMFAENIVSELDDESVSLPDRGQENLTEDEKKKLKNYKKNVKKKLRKQKENKEVLDLEKKINCLNI